MQCLGGVGGGGGGGGRERDCRSMTNCVLTKGDGSSSPKSWRFFKINNLNLQILQMFNPFILRTAKLYSECNRVKSQINKSENSSVTNYVLISCLLRP